MSDTVVKTAIRLYLPKLDGYTVHEVYEYLLPILGEPEYVWWKDDLVNFFEYDNYSILIEDNKWGIDSLLTKPEPIDDFGGMNVLYEIIQKKCKRLAKKFKRPINKCRIVCSIWNTGVEELVDLK